MTLGSNDATDKATFSVKIGSVVARECCILPSLLLLQKGQTLKRKHKLCSAFLKKFIQIMILYESFFGNQPESDR